MVLPARPPEYDAGDAPVITGEFRDRVTGALANPTTVVAKVVTPNGVESTYTTATSPAVTNVSTGVFALQLPKITLADPAGQWSYRFEGDGDLIDAGEGTFVVRASAFAAAVAPNTLQWISGRSLEGDIRLKDSPLPPGITLDDCAEAATKVCFNRTGRRYRFRTKTIRPNARTCGCCVEDCWSNREMRLEPPVDPDSIVVTVDGIVLPVTSYDLYDQSILVRTDGLPWPWCQHLSSPNGMAGSWSITYTTGRAPSADLLMACRELAIHIALQMASKPSKLPARTTNVGRRGVNINLGGTGTGIPFVEQILRSDNPKGLQRRARVTSPDTIRRSAL